MTTTPDANPPAETADGAPAPTRRRLASFDLSATQLMATALAAITATIAASYLGVSGTVIGAALASVVSAIGNAVYGHSLRSTRGRRGSGSPPGASSGRRAQRPPTEENLISERPPTLPEPERVGRSRAVRSGTNRAGSEATWRRIAIGSIAAFVAVLAVVTGVEIVAGRPLSDLVRGDGGTGTSVFGPSVAGTAGGGGASTPAELPTVTRTVTPAVVVTTPTVTRTAPAVTRTAHAFVGTGVRSGRVDRQRLPPDRSSAP